MKKTLLLFAFLLVISASYAQSNVYKSDVLKFMKSSGGIATMEVAKKQILAMIPQAKHAAFLVEFDATLPSLYDKLAEVYMKTYTHEEIKQLISFYETPIGKKLGEKAGVIFEQSMQVSQEWAETLRPMMMKYVE